jgi:Flp pilus assembly pilin Flp
MGGIYEGLSQRFWMEDDGAHIAEYGVMLVAILLIMVGTLRLVTQAGTETWSAI